MAAEMVKTPKPQLDSQARYDRRKSANMTLVKIWLTKDETDKLDTVRGDKPRATWVGDVVRSILGSK